MTKQQVSRVLIVQNETYEVCHAKQIAVIFTYCSENSV